jgi:putative phosphoesterase
MKLAVFSDSHGKTSAMIRTIRAEHPDLILHLGDYVRDAQTLKEEFPHTAIKAVRGNCDLGSDLPETEIFNCMSVRIMLTHGHKYHVKTGLDSLLLNAKLSDVDLVLFGHTHIARFEQYGKLHVLNPGTAGQGYKCTWASVEICPNGAILCEIHPLND